MPRNAVAIWLKLTFLLACIPLVAGWAPIPEAFGTAAEWHSKATLWLILIGCALSLGGIFWPDRLDGGAIEQLGLVVLTIGMLVFVYALTKTWPETWWGVCVYSGLTVAFAAQWWNIYRFRRSLRDAAGSDG